jgi:hypothetical protein
VRTNRKDMHRAFAATILRALTRTTVHLGVIPAKAGT